MKINYEYDIAGVKVNTREAARIIQRNLRTPDVKAPRIIQKMTVTKVVR